MNNVNVWSAEFITAYHKLTKKLNPKKDPNIVSVGMGKDVIIMYVRKLNKNYPITFNGFGVIVKIADTPIPIYGKELE